MSDFASMYRQRDRNYWEFISNLVDREEISIEFLLKNYMTFVQRRDLGQLLAYYELFKLVKDLPGSIAEVGVFAGNGLFTWSKLMDTFVPTNKGRKVFGFDNYKGYSQTLVEKDVPAVEFIEGLIGDFIFDPKLVEELVKYHNLDQVIAGVERVRLYNADLEVGLDAFKKENIGVRFSLALIDVNLYNPTKWALENFYKLVVPGGIIALRGYGVKPWEGESLAVDEFLKEKKIREIKSFDFSNYPSIFFRKSHD
jgi:hypothetical protein